MDWGIKRYPMYIGGIKQAHPHIQHDMSFASRAVTVGSLVFLSGMTGINLQTGKVVSGQIEAQVAAALDNIRAALEEAGTSLNNLVKHQICLKNAADSPRVWRAMLNIIIKTHQNL